MRNSHSSKRIVICPCIVQKHIMDMNTRSIQLVVPIVLYIRFASQKMFRYTLLFERNVLLMFRWVMARLNISDSTTPVYINWIKHSVMRLMMSVAESGAKHLYTEMNVTDFDVPMVRIGFPSVFSDTVWSVLTYQLFTWYLFTSCRLKFTISEFRD